MNTQEKKEALVQAVEEIAGKEAAYWEGNPKMQETFQNCYVSTAKTTTKFLESGEAYVFTGDIAAMWLRDSSAQVVHYLPYLKEYPILKEMVKGLIARQAKYVHIDPYANAFNEEDNGNCWEKDLTKYNPELRLQTCWTESDNHTCTHHHSGGIRTKSYRCNLPVHPFHRYLRYQTADS